MRVELHEQEAGLLFQIKGKRVEFERSLSEAHRRLKTGFFRWLVTYRPQNLITGPIIYSMIFPLLVLDICVTFVEKFHCTYCAYGAGLIAYVGEIVARTEQYFCPIKHARKVLGIHRRYSAFLAYGEAEGYAGKLEQFRVAPARRS